MIPAATAEAETPGPWRISDGSRRIAIMTAVVVADWRFYCAAEPRAGRSSNRNAPERASNLDIPAGLPARQRRGMCDCNQHEPLVPKAAACGGG
jgi:hypothetical protein